MPVRPERKPRRTYPKYAGKGLKALTFMLCQASKEVGEVMAYYITEMQGVERKVEENFGVMDNTKSCQSTTGSIRQQLGVLDSLGRTNPSSCPYLQQEQILYHILKSSNSLQSMSRA